MLQHVIWVDRPASQRRLAGWQHHSAAAGHAAPGRHAVLPCCARCGHPAIQQSIWLTGRLITWLCTCSKGTAQLQEGGGSQR